MDGDNSCIYYYDSGTSIIINDNINYYNIKNKNINEIYLIDNDLFNTEMKQLIKLYKINQVSENYITKEIINSSLTDTFKFDTIDGLYYNSEFIQEQFNIQYFNTDKMGLVGDNEILVNMILEYGTSKIYYPLIIAGYGNITIPNIEYYHNGEIYKKSLVVISTKNDGLIPLVNSGVGLLFNGTILQVELEVGTISNTNDTFTPLSEYLIIDNITKKVYVKSGFNIKNKDFSLHLWKIQGSTELKQNYIMYIWTLFINDTFDNSILLAYLNLLTDTINKIGISEPLLLDNTNELTILNYGSTHNLLECYPSILKDVKPNFKLKTDNLFTVQIAYKYYMDVRHIDTDNYKHKVKQLNFNNKLNIKPSIELATNSYTFLDQLNDKYTNNNAIIIIFVWTSKNLNKKEISIFLKSDTVELDKFINLVYNENSDVSLLSTYFSINYPFYISNHINITPKLNNMYQIDNYNKLFLEQNEIIIIDGNYFYVEGLNVFNDKYEIRLVKKGNELRYNYTGYYTIGNYLKKDNKQIPDLVLNTTMTFYQNVNLY
jgi:hypothetical protein